MKSPVRRHIMRPRPFLAVACLLTLMASVAMAAPLREEARILLADLDSLSADDRLTDTALATAFLDRVERGFHLDAMATAALPGVAQMGRADRDRYFEAFRIHLALVFLDARRRFGATSSTLLNVRARRDGGMAVFFASQSGGHSYNSAWLLCDDQTFRVCAVEVDGMRVSTRQRDTFEAVLRRDGFEALLTALRSGRLVRS